MNKKKIILINVLIFIIVIIFVMIFLLHKNNKNISNIPNDYIAVFHGGVGEITYSTYIYKIDNGQANYGFEYINTTNTTKSWGSTERNIKITKKGKFDWTDGAFIVAKENGAYSYVQLPNSKKTYSIEEFQRMFLMN